MSELTKPLEIGYCRLMHRVVMAPMTRLRADDKHIPGQMVFDYYAQRASVPGTLLITEATFISPNSRGRDENAPGIYTDEQIQAWKRITDEVHAKKSMIFMQLWHVGRAARKKALEKAGLEMVSSGDIPISDDLPHPRPMSPREIMECIDSFAQAAQNAMSAGFDGVEIHGANGYLIDQFTQDTCNNRSDEWGGSIENRSRFCFKVLQAVCNAIGPERTAIRLSPFSTFQGMGMKDPVPQFTDLISRLKTLRPAYLHLIEPRVAGNMDKESKANEDLAFAIKAWSNTSPIILAGGYSQESATQAMRTTLKDHNVAFAFGRYFISNPDLPFKLVEGIDLNHYQRDSFYTVKSAVGYTDYPFCETWKEKTSLKPAK